jgi:hypothetical protein
VVEKRELFNETLAEIRHNPCCVVVSEKVKLMKLTKFLSVGVLLLAVPSAWGQTIEPGTGRSTVLAPAAVSPTLPAERVAPGVPGIPPNTPKPVGPSVNGATVNARKEAYLSKKIADAKAHGQDVTTAKSQEALGQAALNRGMNEVAARHFKTAFRSIGVIPIGLDEDAGLGSSDN